MRKEILVVIIIGLILGFGITYGLHTSQQTVTENPEALATPSPSPEALDPTTTALSLHSPNDESVQTTSEVIIAGTTTAGNIVVIYKNEISFITDADSSGNFSIETKLDKGSNIIQAHSLSSDGETSVLERTVILATEEDLQTEQATETEEEPQ